VSSPVPSPADGAFRLEVGRFRATERRRLFPLVLHVGTPDGPRRSTDVPWPVPREYDAGLRFDLADALLDGLMAGWQGHVPLWGWLTRPGVPVVHDSDLGWFAATAKAVAARERDLAGFRVVTRTGWLDLVSEERRTWKRLRL